MYLLRSVPCNTCKVYSYKSSNFCKVQVHLSCSFSSVTIGFSICEPLLHNLKVKNKEHKLRQDKHGKCIEH